MTFNIHKNYKKNINIKYQKVQKEVPSYLTKVTIINNYNKSVQVTVSYTSPDIVPTPPGKNNISSEIDTIKPKEKIEITKGAIISVTIISSDKKKVLPTSDLNLKQTPKSNSVTYTLDDEFNVTTSALNSDKSYITVEVDPTIDTDDVTNEVKVTRS